MRLRSHASLLVTAVHLFFACGKEHAQVAGEGSRQAEAQSGRDAAVTADASHDAVIEPTAGTGGKRSPGAETAGGSGTPGDSGTQSRDAARDAGRNAGTDAGTPEPACASGRTLKGSRALPRVLLVVDGSGSMCAPFGNETRWSALRSALLDPAQGVVRKLELDAAFGLMIFDGGIDLSLSLTTGPGTSSGPSCAIDGTQQAAAVTECPRLIEVQPAVRNASALDSAWPRAEPGGSTPTHKAMTRAVEQLLAAPSAGTYIVLATDGVPNDICMGGSGGDGSAQRQAVLEAVDRAATNGITTLVVGLAANDAALHAQLEEVARHGDPANPSAHSFAPTNPEELLAQLDTLLQSTIGCEFALDVGVRPAAACTGSVQLNGKQLPCCELNGNNWSCNGSAVDAPSGFRLENANTLELLGQACTALASPATTLTVSYPCTALAMP